MRSGLPGVNYGHTYGLKVIHISGHNRHAVNKGSGRDESVTIAAGSAWAHILTPRDMRLFPTIAAVAWHPEFLRPLFGTTCGTECGFGTLGALDPAFSPECPGSSQQLHRGGLPCPDHPLYSCVRFLIFERIIDKR